MGDAIECATCKRRTVGEFCSECVKKHAEVEDLAARFLGPVITAEILSNADAQQLQSRRELVQVAFDYAEVFVAIRNERRRRSSDQTFASS